MSTSLSFYSNIFGFVVGGVSPLGFVLAVCRPQLPSNKIKTLESLLHETETIFNEAAKDGLLEFEFARMAEHHLAALQSRAYNATSLCKDYAEFLNGTSTVIENTCQSLKMLRAEGVRSSEERRLKLIQLPTLASFPLRLFYPLVSSYSVLPLLSLLVRPLALVRVPQPLQHGNPIVWHADGLVILSMTLCRVALIHPQTWSLGMSDSRMRDQDRP